MKVFNVLILALFALPTTWHLIVYYKKSEKKPTRSTTWGILTLCGISIAYVAWLIAYSRFY